jgi:hypothetical protein
MGKKFNHGGQLMAHAARSRHPARRPVCSSSLEESTRVTAARSVVVGLTARAPRKWGAPHTLPLRRGRQ